MSIRKSTRTVTVHLKTRFSAHRGFRSAITFFFLIVIVAKIGFFLWQQPNNFSKFDPEAFRRNYLGSTYSFKGGAPISDYIVYGHAAWEYIHGKNPTLINPEMPPLGKYLMGISILLFKRIEIGSLIFGLLSLLLIYFLGKLILRSTNLALIPVVLMVFEPLFIKQINTALLDIYHLFFILLAFHCFLLAQKREKFFILASLALGGVMAVKFYSTGIVIALSWIITLVIQRRYRVLSKLLITLPLAIFVLALSYLKIFLEGESLRRFLGIQKWMFHFHSGGKFLVPAGAIWQLIFLKKWVTWWADRRPLPAPDWQITWPVAIAVSLGLAVLKLFKPVKLLKKEVQVLLSWIIIYLVSLSFGIAYPRYLLPVLPFAYIVSVLAIQSLLSTALRPTRGIKKVK